MRAREWSRIKCTRCAVGGASRHVLVCTRLAARAVASTVPLRLQPAALDEAAAEARLQPIERVLPTLQYALASSDAGASDQATVPWVPPEQPSGQQMKPSQPRHPERPPTTTTTTTTNRFVQLQRMRCSR